VPRLTARERREGYLREYGYQQRTGKSFFPYALFHDVVANCFFVLLIVGLACLWYFTASHGVDINHGGKSGVLGPLYENRADPAVETYDPRPEWYFFFLFELLRLFQNPNLLLLATIIIPTAFMVILIGMPFIDRSRERRLSRRPIAVGFAGAMAVLLLGLTWYGSKAPGAAVKGTTQLAFTANLPCASCHTMKAADGWNGNIGPNLDTKQPTYQLAVDRITNGKGVMPAFKGNFSDAKIKCVAAFVATESRGGKDTDKLGGSPDSPANLCKGIQ
jgi:quinol-cytochrome oxidoreductase complex cytochrome b subunit